MPKEESNISEEKTILLERQDSGLATDLAPNHRNQFNCAFFNKMRNSISKQQPLLSLDTATIITEYLHVNPCLEEILNEIKLTLLAEMTSMAFFRNKNCEALEFKQEEKEEDIEGQIANTENILFLNLEKLLDIYIPDMTEEVIKKLNQICLWEDHLIQLDRPYDLLSPQEKAVVLEIYVLKGFYVNYDFEPCTFVGDWPYSKKAQIKLYAFKYYIENGIANPSFIKLLDSFFNLLRTMLPNSVNVAELQKLDFFSTLSSHWYNTFLFEGYKQLLTVEDCNKDNYEQKVAVVLQTSSDSLKQFIIIEKVWVQISSFISLGEFVKLLSAYAKNGVSAAAAWIISTFRYSSSRDGFDLWSMFSMKDLFQFVCDSTSLDCYDINFYREHFFQGDFIHQLLQEQDDMAIMDTVSPLTGCPAKPNIPLLKLGMLLCELIDKQRPELGHEFTAIRSNLTTAIAALQSKENLNPLCRDSGFFKEILETLAAMNTSSPVIESDGSWEELDSSSSSCAVEELPAKAMDEAEKVLKKSGKIPETRTIAAAVPTLMPGCIRLFDVSRTAQELLESTSVNKLVL